MKICISTSNNELINAFNKCAKTLDIKILNAKAESTLTSIIENNEADAFILDENTHLLNKNLSLIKRGNINIPILVFGKFFISRTNIDIISFYDESLDYDIFVSISIQNVMNFHDKFEKLQKLTAKMSEVINFGNCAYDPTRRMLSFKGKEIKKLSAKEGGIVETLATNFGQVVTREILLEKVWHKPGSDYFAGRSMDVYITHIRKLFEINKTQITIKNISKIGLILE